MTTPNFRKGVGRLATDRYDFEAHLEGRNPDAGSSYVHGFRHTASQIDVDNPSLVYGNPDDVEEALENITDFISLFSSIGQGFITVGDGYDTWHNADGNINFDPAIQSIDRVLNEIFSTIYSGSGILPAYERIKYGGIVVIKAGTYIVKNTINVPPGIVILGEGYGTKIINATGLSIPSIGSAPIYRSTFNVSTATAATPIQVTTTTSNDVVTGETVVISDINGVTGANGTFVVTVINDTNFTLNGSVGTGAYINGGTVTFARPVFNILPDLNRSTNDEAIDPNVFAFSRASKFMNLVIADNFVENTILGDVFYRLPQNRDDDIPLIRQSVGSSLELQNVYMLGRVNFSAGTVVSIATSHAVQLDTAAGLNDGTILKINNCVIDGFSQPIDFASIGGTNDYLEVSDSKIRAHGYLNADGATAANNCIISMNDNNAIVTSNYLYGNHALCKTVVYIDAVLSAPVLQSISKIVIAGNDLAINKTGAAAITPTTLSLNAGITTTILTRATVLAYGNTFQDTTGFIIEDASGTLFSATKLVTTLPVGVKHKVVTVTTSTYTVDGTSPDYMLFVDTTDTAITITLPAHNSGRKIVIKDIGFNASFNNITLARSGGTGSIDDYAGNRIIATNGASWTLISNGTNWYII